MVIIEEDEFNQLHEHALKRSDDIALENMQALKNTPQENYKARQPWENASKAARESHDKFKNLNVGHHLNQIQLSQQNLMHLLQWSKGITLFYSTIGGGDAALQVSLGQSTLTPSKLLAAFIAQASKHEQNSKWIWI